MKVVLTAFARKLMSKPMDWPDKSGPVIYMAMDFDTSFFSYTELDPRITTLKKGKFEMNYKCLVVGEDLCMEYKLVEWIGDQLVPKSEMDALIYRLELAESCIVGPTTICECGDICSIHLDAISKWRKAAGK